MENKTKISIFLALLIIISTFTVVGSGVKKNSVIFDRYPNGEIEFTKTVWNETSQAWEDAIYDVKLGDTVRFNLSLTYYKNQTNPLEWVLNDINITDILPDCLIFSGNVEIYNAPDIQEVIIDNYVIWNFTDVGHELPDEESMSIEFDCTATESEETENENIAVVSAWEGDHCHYHEAQDNAWVFIYVPPPLEVEKEVWDPVAQEWVDLLEGIQIGMTVKFRIVVIYNGFENIDPMKSMIVDDYLPDCCIKYSEGTENFIYPDEDRFQDPFISIVGNHIKYNWTNRMFNLFAGETLPIEFETEVFEYCYGEIENCAYVDLFSFSEKCDQVHLYGNDCAYVNCTPLPTTFEKKVWDTELGWTEETSGYVDDEFSFQIKLTYYGNDNLTEISIFDQLPCCLEFIKGSANPEETNISEDLKKIWWNFTEPLEDGETITIEFDALAVGTTSCGTGTNNADVYALEIETPYEDSDTANVTIDINNPPCAPDIDGDLYGAPDEELTFRGTSCDPNNDNIYYWFEWGDESNSVWEGPYESCEEIVLPHSWGEEGEYEVKAKAKDEIGEESGWTIYPLTVIIEEPDNPSLAVSINSGFHRSLSFNIENSGDVDVNLITWNITVSRRNLQKVFLNRSDCICTIKFNETREIVANPFGFGLIEVIVNAKADYPNVEPVQDIKQGFIFGKFVRIK